jgi:hypothetical protein
MTNPYAPPSAQLTTAQTPPDLSEAPFYVVSLPKMLILGVATLGWYWTYWFWRHWQTYKRTTNANIWPLPRAFFMIFTAHTLFETIATRLSRQKIRHAWSPGMWATLYVLVAIEQPFAVLLLKIFSTKIMVLTVNGIAIALGAVALAQAQRAANLASGDASGSSNKTITFPNLLWMTLGLALWFFVLRETFPAALSFD